MAARAVATAKMAVPAAVAGGGTSGLLHWISQHLKELKKVLVEILHLIFDLLGLRWPSWLDRIIQILDQMLDLLLSLLGEVFGIQFREAASSLSTQETNFTREMAAFELLRRAQRSPTFEGEES